MKIKWPKYIFALLVTGFFAFTFYIYSSGNYNYRNQYDRPLAQRGELVWQKYNCQSCHQMYGLGGYLGPDLTNLVSSKGKSEAYILALIQTGNLQMPSYNLSEDEKRELMEFLKSTDASGVSDPRSFEKEITGMISKDGEPK